MLQLSDAFSFILILNVANCNENEEKAKQKLSLAVHKMCYADDDGKLQYQ